MNDSFDPSSLAEKVQDISSLASRVYQCLRFVRGKYKTLSPDAEDLIRRIDCKGDISLNDTEVYIVCRLLGWMPEPDEVIPEDEDTFKTLVQTLYPNGIVPYTGKKRGRPFGYQHTEETKRKISESRKGTPAAIAWGKRLRDAKERKRQLREGGRPDEEVGESDVLDI